jgi:signal transduction histidine kinase/ActR/RegA family two-component response regulator
MAIGAMQQGRERIATRLLERAYSSKLAAGDLSGAANTLHNLAILHADARLPLRAAGVHLQAVALGTRFAMHEATARALQHLAAIYDRQQNPTLALRTLERALHLAHTTDLPNRAALCARRLATLQAGLGMRRAARASLLSSALWARRSRSADQVGEHFAASIQTFLHLGHPAEQSRRTGLAQRTASTLTRLEVQMMQMVDGVAHGTFNFSPFTGVRQTPRLPEHRSHQRILDALRLACDPTHRLRTHTRFLFDPHGEGASVSPAPHFRLVVEALLAVARCPTSTSSAKLTALDLSLPTLERQGLFGILARASALRFLAVGRTGADSWSHADVSKALEAITRSGDPASALPIELVLAGDRMRSALQLPAHVSPLRVDDLHALAHRMLLRWRPPANDDARVATALRRLLDVTSKLVTTAGLDALLESITQYSLQITGAQRACIVLVKPDAELEIRVETSATISGAPLRLTDLSHTIIGRVLSTRAALLVHDVFDDSELMIKPSIAGLSLRSVLCVPLVRGSTLYGVMYADNSAAAGSFDDVDLDVFTVFAEQAAGAIEAGRLVDDLQQSYRDLKTMQERLLQGERLRVIGELASGIAHEFNNLLTAILARIQLMELGNIPLDVRDNLAQIERAAMDAAGVVRRLQGFTKNKRATELQVVDVAGLCGDVVELLKPLWSVRKLHGKPIISVRARAERNLVVKGDPVELREVLTNLLKNSLEALGSAGGAVEIAATLSGPNVRIEVSDNGPGIRPEERGKLFVPFYTTKGERGTGLGLCLSQQIVERHGGTITVSSDLGSGTSVVVSLPVSREARTAQPVAPAATQASSFDVVVVDDDPSVLAVLCAYLEKMGYRVRGLSSGAEGLRAVVERPPDVVLSDIGMPGMDGIELCRSLKERVPKLPVILMSGQASSIEGERIRRSGASALLPKPFTMRQVTEVLNAMAAGTRSP